MTADPIYTDTFQWLLLIAGLVFIGIPLSYVKLGGYDAIVSQIPNAFLRLDNVSVIQVANWFVTIVPIWFVGMTLYQRIYACRDEKTAKKAWLIAGLFEYPIMAFMGVLLGLFARVGADQGMFEAIGYASATGMDSELGLPLLLRHVLPVGLLGLMLSAYFSAIMSTVDSCLLAASGNLMTDILKIPTEHTKGITISQVLTMAVGLISIVLATMMTSVLDLMLMSYAFMVSGLIIPVLALLFLDKPNPIAAFWSMLLGGSTTIALTLAEAEIPFGFDPILVGVILSAVVFYFISKLNRNTVYCS